MNPCREIDKATWPRAELFDFYWKFASPAINVSVTLDAAALSACAKERGESYFLLSLYAILRAANRVPEMRQRCVDGKLIEFVRIAAMTPIMTEREMFQQIWCEYAPTFVPFARAAETEIAKVKRGEPTTLGDGEDFICASFLPWLHFTHITQADHGFHQTVPILAWGKMKNGQVPISCKFSHAFMDGLHVSRFYNAIEEYFAEPGKLWEAEETAQSQRQSL